MIGVPIRRGKCGHKTHREGNATCGHKDRGYEKDRGHVGMEVEMKKYIYRPGTKDCPPHKRQKR